MVPVCALALILAPFSMKTCGHGSQECPAPDLVVHATLPAAPNAPGTQRTDLALANDIHDMVT
jgi:hypothetical protein